MLKKELEEIDVEIDVDASAMRFTRGSHEDHTRWKVQ